MRSNAGGVADSWADSGHMLDESVQRSALAESGGTGFEVALPVEWHAEPMALDPYRSPEID